MESLKVAMLQMVPMATLKDNMDKGIEYCRRAKTMGADIALFPEMWSNGYDVCWDKKQLKAKAVSIESEYIQSFQKLAKELDMAIAVTLLESFEPAPRNTVCLIDRFGKIKLTYAKVHTCDFDVESNLCPGEDFYVTELDVNSEMVKIGAMICYDREFPESARVLMLKGAEIILVPNACPMEINRLSQLRSRSFENMVGIATCNYAYGMPDCNGHSTAFDGIAYKEGESGSRDTLMIEAGEREGIYIADFPINEIRQYRQNEVHGNCYRHPQKYQILVEDCIEEPFIRKDYRK